MKISEGLSYRPNFINYTYRDDMVSDGIENCLLYINNFNPDKSANPFSYFTQIIYFAFIRRIQKEKKQLYIKYKSIYTSNALETEGVDVNDVTTVKDSYLNYIRDNRSNIDKFLYEFEKFQEDKRISRNSVKSVKSNKIEKHNENRIDN
jgi:DNA-directed RNA polymerase specialized sigma24 family protein